MYSISQKVAIAATVATLLCSGIVNPARAMNLVFNGDFSAGDTGFSSNYSSDNSHDLFPAPARYAVGSDPHDHHSLFSSFGDHTTGDGLMMIVNGGSFPEGAGPLVWSQTIDVLPDTEYNLSAWISSTISVATAQLQFAIDAQVIGPVLNASTDTSGFWEKLSTTWNSGSSTSVEFSIVNHNPIWLGNDFAVDDILFTAADPETSIPDPSAIFGLGTLVLVSGLLRQRKC